MLQAVRLLTEMARTSDDHSRNDGGSSSRQPASSSSETNSVLFREIYKNGWLRRADVAFWVTFCVHDDTEPFLEGFIDEKQAATHSPVWSQLLRNLLYLSPTLCATSKNDYEFCINFSEETVRLAAPSYQAMNDWVQVITRKLTDMKLLKPKENVYSRGPERIATRDPTSPLPPPPILNPIQRTPANTSVFTFDDVNISDRRTRNNPISTRQPNSTTNVNNENEESSRYESVFLASSYPPQGGETSRQNNNRLQNSNNDDNDQYAVLMEYRSSNNPDIGIQNRQTNALVTLREQQVLKLTKEMSHPAGVRIKLGRRDCKDGIAFVDCFDKVWIAGWKHKEHPILYNVLHIGDLVISIAGIRLNGASGIKDILRNYSSPRVEMVVRRLPHARVMTLTRRTENEDFGLEVNGNEVISISESVQSSLGLSTFTATVDPSADSNARISWTLTEVNNRPLNLLDGNARERLNTVGRDVSVVLQPSDLISNIKKKLRSIRGYKSFVL